MHFVNLGNEMRNRQSVTLGVRLYEESTQPQAHAKDGKVKTVDDINRTIAAMASRMRFLPFLCVLYPSGAVPF